MHSFDVFDTCLVRVFVEPEHLLFPLAENMLSEARVGQARGRVEVSELVKGRIAAQRRAVLAADGEDASLADIYRHFGELPGWGISADRMLQAEIALELASVRPVAETRRRIESVRRSQGRVLFISDSHLPPDVIRRMLTDAGISQPDDALYVSATEGSTKRSGNLFRLVLAREDLAPGDLKHYGHDPVSDHMVPARLGIDAELSTQASLNRYEKAAMAEDHPLPWVKSQMAGTRRAVRLGLTDEGDTWLPKVVPIVAGAVGPLFVGFVAWVIEQARRDGVKRLYFVARDGQVLHRIARELAGGAEDLELLYLYGSRQAWYLPSVQEATRPELEFLLQGSQSMAPEDNLRKLHITPDMISKALKRHGFPPSTWDRQLDAQEAERFWEVLTDPNVTRLVEDNARRAREVTLKYLSQEGLLDDDKWALVDIGWNLTGQRALKKILGTAGQHHMLGYYLGIAHHRTRPDEHGRAVGLIVEELDYGIRFPGRTSIFDNKGLLDQVFTLADHGRTLGYMLDRDKAAPVLEEEPYDPREDALRMTIQETAAALAGEAVAVGLVPDRVTELAESGRLAMDIFMAKPRRSEVSAIAWAPVSYDPNDVHVRTVPLARRLTVGTLWQIAWRVTRRLTGGARVTRDPYEAFAKDLSWGFSWLEGSAALSGPPTKLAVKVFKAANRLLNARNQIVAVAVTGLAKWRVDPARLLRRRARTSQGDHPDSAPTLD